MVAGNQSVLRRGATQLFTREPKKAAHRGKGALKKNWPYLYVQTGSRTQPESMAREMELHRAGGSFIGECNRAPSLQAYRDTCTPAHLQSCTPALHAHNRHLLSTPAHAPSTLAVLRRPHRHRPFGSARCQSRDDTQQEGGAEGDAVGTDSRQLGVHGPVVGARGAARLPGPASPARRLGQRQAAPDPLRNAPRHKLLLRLVMRLVTLLRAPFAAPIAPSHRGGLVHKPSSATAVHSVPARDLERSSRLEGDCCQCEREPRAPAQPRRPVVNVRGRRAP